MKFILHILFSILTIFFTNISDGFSIISFVEKSETQKVSVACGNTEYWNSLKPVLESLNRQLNGSWGVNVIDRDGNSYSLVTGSQGTITYKYDKNTKNWTVDIPGIANEEVKQIITGAISQKLNAFQIDENGKSQLTTTVSSFSTEDGGEFSFGAGLHWYEWGSVLCDAGISVYETARLPETYWNQNNPKYKGYPLHASPTFCGVADGAIEEITGTAQLVKLGLEIVTDKEKAKALWESIKKINLSTIKQAAVGAIKDKWDRYANSPDYITYHELGKDGVQIASLIYGGFAAKGKKLSEAVDESGKIIGKKVRKFTQKEIDDYVKLATKNERADKVMLGKYIENSPMSYERRALSDGCTYYQLDDWQKLYVEVGESYDEMWKINKQFLDEQIAKGKTFYFSHDPNTANTQGFIREVHYLKEKGFTKFDKIAEDLWIVKQ